MINAHILWCCRLVTWAFAWAFVFGNHAIAQQQNSTLSRPSTIQINDPFDHLRQSTISIGILSKDKGKQSYATKGSGIIVASDNHTGCLLTAQHVFFDPQDGWIPTQVSIRPPPASGKEDQDFGVTLNLIEHGKNLWLSPSDGADLAVIPLPQDLHKYSTLHAVTINDFGNSEDIYQGASILALGYPALLGEDFLTTPYARGGIVSWTDLLDPVNKPFLIDANLYPGNSGGPVFHIRNGFSKSGALQLGGGVALIGIVSKGAKEMAAVVAGGVPIQATNTQTGATNPAQAMVLGIGGIGIIEPVSRAKAILSECLQITP